MAMRVQDTKIQELIELIADKGLDKFCAGLRVAYTQKYPNPKQKE